MAVHLRTLGLYPRSFFIFECLALFSASDSESPGIVTKQVDGFHSAEQRPSTLSRARLCFKKRTWFPESGIPNRYSGVVRKMEVIGCLTSKSEKCNSGVRTAVSVASRL